MNNKIMTLISFFFMGLLLVSCSEDEIDKSTVTRFQSFTIDNLPDRMEVQEENQTLVFDFTFDENQIFEVHLDIAQSGGTATEDADFSLPSHSLTIPTLQRGGSFEVNILEDLLTEGDESVFLTVSSATPHELPVSKTMEIVIKDVIKDELYLSFDWDTGFTFDGVDYTFCQFVDMDVYVLDADGNDLGIYDAATGACPEVIIVDSSWEDGEYFLASNLWDLGPLNGLMIGSDMPLTMNAFRQNIFDASTTPTDVWTTEDLDQATGGNTSFKEVGKLVVANGTYTVTAPDGTLVAMGFEAPDEVVEGK